MCVCVCVCVCACVFYFPNSRNGLFPMRSDLIVCTMLRECTTGLSGGALAAPRCPGAIGVTGHSHPHNLNRAAAGEHSLQRRTSHGAEAGQVCGGPAPAGGAEPGRRERERERGQRRRRRRRRQREQGQRKERARAAGLAHGSAKVRIVAARRLAVQEDCGGGEPGRRVVARRVEWRIERCSAAVERERQAAATAATQPCAAHASAAHSPSGQASRHV